MRVALLTKEWPPNIYGGAGVHVEYLEAALSQHIDVSVHTFGEERENATGHQVPDFLRGTNPALETLGINLEIVKDVALENIDVVHSHTWYTNFAGQVAALITRTPLIVTAHSLEPLRPWKEEQLGGGYRVSSWIEKTAYESAAAIIAVSAGMKADVLASYPAVDPDRVHVIHNGIDTDVFRPDISPAACEKYGISTEHPYALFVGRITRQKGLPHLLAAARWFDDNTRLVLCASSPDTPELAAEVSELVAELRATRGPDSVVWIEEQVPRADLLQLLTAATVFTCPSIYEPQGIVNLEAMACETAVVASNVGGIPEVVVDQDTGLLVPYDPVEPRAFERAFADSVNRIVADPALAKAMGARGRARAVTDFGWDAIAEQTISLYRSTVNDLP